MDFGPILGRRAVGHKGPCRQAAARQQLHGTDLIEVNDSQGTMFLKVKGRDAC